MKIMPRLLLLIDGLSDRPHPLLDQLTPLQVATIPNLDRLAREGLCGQADPLPNGKTATTVHGTLAVLGYDPLHYPVARGVIEALGCGVNLTGEEVALRGNWACLDENGFLKDRRAGRIRDGTRELVQELKRIREWNDYHVDVFQSTEHRAVIILSGPELSDQISGSDPGDHHPSGIPPRIPQPLDQQDARARKTAELLQRFELSARNLLVEHPLNKTRSQGGLFPANAIISREPGKLSTTMQTLKRQSFSTSLISGENTLKGIACITGMDFRTLPSMTGNLDTDLTTKFELAAELLTKQDLVLLHIKGTDIAAHNRDPKSKRDFLMRLDQELGRFLEGQQSALRIAVTSDHSTSCITGTHLHDPVPVVLWGPGIEKDSVEGFDEVQVAQGGLGRFKLSKLWNRLMG